MDLQIKTEQVESEFVSAEIYQDQEIPSKVCCLCPAGQVLQDELINLLELHNPQASDCYPLNILNSPQIVQDQIQLLISHILSHIRFMTIKNEPESIDPTELLQLEAGEDFKTSNFSDEQQVPDKKIRKKRVDKPPGAFKVHREFTVDSVAGKFICNYCSRQFTLKTGVQKHLNLFHDPNSPRDMQSARQVVEADHKVAKIECPRCQRNFMTISGLNRHMELIHEFSAPTKCPKCDTFWANPREFNAHLDSHSHSIPKLSPQHSTEEIICLTCFKVFPTRKQLFHHSYTHRDKNLQCDYCGNPFNSKQHLLRHILRHRGIKLYKSYNRTDKIVCDECSTLVNPYRMKRHKMNKHSIEKQFKCDKCPASFGDSRTLEGHRNAKHLGHKPFVCEFCSEGFHHASNLRQHRIRHTDPDRYKCPTCSECFVTKQACDKHVTRTHLDTNPDIRPYACEIEGCTSTFKHSDHLKRHHRSVHSTKPTVEMHCDYCNFVAHNKKNHQQHMRRAHNIRSRNTRVFPPTASI